MVNRRTLWLTAGWALVAAVVYLSLTPRPPDIPVDQGDKLGHVAAYAAMMWWFAQACGLFRQRLVLAILLAALGIAMEFAQLYTGYRTCDVADMIANLFGVAVGWLIVSRTPVFLTRPLPGRPT